MHRYLQFVMVVMLVGALPHFAFAVDTADCASVLGVSKNKSFQSDPKDVQQCIMRGYDPPANWRPNNGKSPGVNVSGARGFSYGSVAAPENSPGKVGAGSSVSSDFMSFINKFFGSSTNSGKTSDGKNICAVSSDATGLYGAVVGLAPGDTPFSCGSAVSLTSYESSLTANANSLALASNGEYKIWVYQQSGSAFHASMPNPVILPQHLYHKEMDCTGSGGGGGGGDGGGGGGDASCVYKCIPVDINPPVSQVITYNNSTADEFMVHLISTKKGMANISALAPDPSTPEKYLRIPLDPATRQPKVPTEAECPLVEDYYREVDSVKADFVMYPAVSIACPISSTAPCTGAASTVSPNASCDTLAIYPKGSPSGVVCDGKIQYMVLDRSTLLYPPGGVASFDTIDGFPYMLARSSTDSVLYAQSKALLQLFPTAPPMTLNEGGMIAMTDGSKLIMQAPVTVYAASNRVMLTGGGALINRAGSLVLLIPANTMYSLPGPIIPLRMQLGRSVTLPAGYLLMTQPTPTARLPIDPPPR